MKRILCCYLLCLFTLTSALAQTSLGYTTHKVTSGQTLYAISRQYGVSVAELTRLNPGAKSGLKAGQVLKVPVKNAEATTTTEKPATTPVAKPEPAQTSKPAAPENSGAKTHKVAPKQTLLGIANRYKVTMAELRKWNNLSSDKLKPGQILIVSGETAAPVTAAEPAKPANEPIKIEDSKVTFVKNEAKAKGDKVKTEIKTETAKSPAGTDTTTDKEDVGLENKTVEYAGKVTETGLAEVINQAGDNNKFLALHKTAPVGTILQVKNIMNGQNVYVRVIGKLPDTGVNDKVIVRISKQAYNRLAALDNRFRVEVSYMP